MQATHPERNLFAHTQYAGPAMPGLSKHIKDKHRDVNGEDDDVWNAKSTKSNDFSVVDETINNSITKSIWKSIDHDDPYLISSK